MKLLQEFKSFVFKGNVVDLAVAVIVGVAFGKVISSFVDDVLMPPIGALTGGVDFSALSISLPGISKPVEIRYGLFLNAVVSFLIAALSVFALIKALSKLHLMKVVATTKPCPECCMQVPLEATKCGHCCSPLTKI